MMRRVLRRATWLFLLMGCGSGSDAPVPPPDGAPADGSPLDASPIDAAPADVPVIDASLLDGPAGDPSAGRLFLTVNELPDYLNGSIPYKQADGVPHEFRVRVNRANFTLDVTGAGIALNTMAVRCDQPVTLPDGMTVAPDLPLPEALYVAGPAPGARRIRFTSPALPDGATVTCRASAAGATPGALTFLAATLPPALDPFPQIDPWVVILSRDLFRLVSTTLPDGTRSLTSVHLPQGNGEADLDEPLYELGLFSRKAPEITRQVKARLLAEVRGKAHRIFGLGNDGLPAQPDGVPLRLWFEGDPGAPAPADFAGGGFSMIALGGDGTPEDQAANLVGRADVDWNNRVRNDDSKYGLGVYPTSIVRQALANPLSLLLLAGILPGRGVPIGENPADAALVDPNFDPAAAGDLVKARHQNYALILNLLSTALASTLCHEIGHSLGLVPSGPPPVGMFAEMPGLSFTVKDSLGPHIDTPGLNVEQTGGASVWMEALNEEPRFNALSLAYLRRRLVVGPPP
jgi:hypothetical protein